MLMFENDMFILIGKALTGLFIYYKKV